MLAHLSPSWILTILLLFVIAAAPVRAALLVPAADSVAHVQGGEHRVEGIIADVERGDDAAVLIVKDLVIDDSAYGDRILVRAPGFPAPAVGDRVAFVCTLAAPEPFNGFAYDRYLAIRDTYAVCRVSDPPLVVTRDADRSFGIVLAKLRIGVFDAIARVLPEPHATLLAGLLLGRATFRDVWDERFRATGTSHVVAASGYNVSSVAFVLFSILVTLGIRRQQAFWFLLCGVVGYVALAGLEPAIVRAGAMGSLVLLARHLGRKTTMRNVVLLAVAVMLAIEPRLLVDDVGFQLSVASTAALIWVAPMLARWLTWIPETFALREVMASTLAAMLCTLPIVILSFGTVSLVTPLVNLLVLPLVPYAMALGASAVVFGALFGPLVAVGSWVALPAWSLLGVMLGIIRASASVPGIVVDIPPSLRGVAAGTTALVLCLLWRKFSSVAQPHSCA